ncbi:nuclear GTP-binding protein nug1 [Saxophila tyrrhenica]|uniref:Nuclear GTP-binding protein nug1 n=1 Tax=Saxophila tyrrhenica TaxID=1690608 RepID=A0AAV9NYB4_9PEZI|nr:nuclear GTP-binding protein nug1 [Saxophila tyrrhenica]
MKVGKPKSKRTPVRLRHKIEKASTAKQRKQRKEAKKNPQWTSRLKKDPGIPNLFPYKAKLLAEVEENKRKKEEEVQRKREIAKAQRQGVAIPEKAVAAEADEGEDDDDILLDMESDVEDGDVEAMDERDESNPMAALLASAQARAQAYGPDDQDEEDEDDADDDEEWGGIEDKNTHPAPGQATRNPLPKQALADPIKAVSALLDRMQQTTDGIQRLLDHYQTPPLMTAGTDMTSSFLVEVARKRGRLGKGGVPNLQSAALVVLSDLNEERLQLPAVDTVSEKKAVSANGKGQVQVVTQLAQPFRIEGLWGDEPDAGGVGVTEEMAVEA